jgi:NTE family protein
MEAHDRIYLEKAEYARTIPIPTLGIGTTDFELSRERAEALYESGATLPRNSWRAGTSTREVDTARRNLEQRE